MASYYEIVHLVLLAELYQTFYHVLFISENIALSKPGNRIGIPGLGIQYFKKQIYSTLIRHTMKLLYWIQQYFIISLSHSFYKAAQSHLLEKITLKQFRHFLLQL